jgi:hypothetical protein
MKSLSTIAQLTRSGRLSEARDLIREHSRRKLVRQDRLQLAHLAHEAFLPAIAIRLLHRVVSPKDLRGSGASANDEEKAEYGRALVSLGATQEAIEILSAVDPRRLPRVYSSLAYAYFMRWEWERAIPVLTRSLAHPALSAREKLLAREGLGIALLHGKRDFEGSRKRLLEVLEETGPGCAAHS